MKSINWSFSLPGFLEIIICEKIFTWGSVEDERIYYKTLCLIKDLYFIVSVTNNQRASGFSHILTFFITLLFSILCFRMDTFDIQKYRYVSIFIDNIPITNTGIKKNKPVSDRWNRLSSELITEK